MQKIDRAGVAFIAGWESFVPYIYDDKARKVGGKPPRWQPGTPALGILTAGFGHTDKGRHPLKMAELLERADLTQEEAYEILDGDLDDVERSVNQLVKVQLTQGQYNALCSLVFNMGAGNFRKSALLARLNAGDYAGARAAFDLYVNSGGQRLAGLVRRRDAEQALFDERHEDAHCPDCDDYVETPKDPDVLPPKRLSESRIVRGAIAAGTSVGLPTVGAGIKATEDAPAAPHAIERVTEIVDRSGTVIDTVRQVQEALPAPPKGFLGGLAHLLTDPVMLALFGLVALGGLGFIVWERRRKLRQEGV